MNKNNSIVDAVKAAKNYKQSKHQLDSSIFRSEFDFDKIDCNVRQLKSVASNIPYYFHIFQNEYTSSHANKSKQAKRQLDETVISCYDIICQIVDDLSIKL